MAIVERRENCHWMIWIYEQTKQCFACKKFSKTLDIFSALEWAKAVVLWAKKKKQRRRK